MQNMVYKLVPQIFKSKYKFEYGKPFVHYNTFLLDEMKRRRAFYESHPEAQPISDKDAGVEDHGFHFFQPLDEISMSYEYDNGWVVLAWRDNYY